MKPAKLLSHLVIPFLAVFLAACTLYYQDTRLGLKFSVFQVCRRIGFTVLAGIAAEFYMSKFKQSHIYMYTGKNIPSGLNLYRQCVMVIGLRMLGGIFVWMYISFLTAFGIVYDVPIPEGSVFSKYLWGVLILGLLVPLSLAFIIGNILFFIVIILKKISKE